MSKNPLVSIITPCYNGEKCLARLMDSVIDQTYRPIEFILVNDGSTDGTQRLAESYADRFEEAGIDYEIVVQENQGLGGAINAGLKRFTGDYLCWPDADDYLEPTSVEERVKVLEVHLDCAVVTTNAYIMDSDNLGFKRVLAQDNEINNDENQFLHHLNGDSIFCSGCHMVRASMFDEVNPSREIYPACRGQNWQMLLPLYYRYRRIFLNVPLYNYIVYPNSMSRDEDKLEDKIARFNEHEMILMSVLDQIEKVQNADVTAYRRFLDDKYGKLRMEVYLRFGEKRLFEQEYIAKQRNVGIDINDRFSLLRMRSNLFKAAYRTVYRIGYRVGLLRAPVPEEIPEKMLYKLKDLKTVRADEPRVSVLVPVFNGEKYIGQCFGCLLNQRYSNIEVIVVNDGSTDSTEEILVNYEGILNERGYRYLHIYQDNARLAVAMNNALRYVTGKYVMIYEVDDILYKDGILDKVRYLEEHPSVSMVRNNGYYIKSFDEIESDLFIYRQLERDEDTVFDNILFGETNNWPGSYLIRVSDFFEALGNNRKIFEHPGGTHLQFMLPMSYNRKVGYINKPLMDYYVHMDSDSHSGGYEANIRRSIWYEEIRIAVIKQLGMSKEQLESYVRTLQRMYDMGRMHIALRGGRREDYDTYAGGLGFSRMHSQLVWIFDKSLIGHVSVFGRHACSAVVRKTRNMACNLKLWRENARGYNS